MSNPQKQKGDKYERELATYINSSTGLNSSRAPLSGGGAIGILSGGSDLLGVPNLFIEAKRVERLNFHEAMRQAERNRENRQTDDVPVVINRKNRMATGESLCLLRLDDLLTFYKAYLKQEGFIHEEQCQDVLSVEESNEKSTSTPF